MRPSHNTACPRQVNNIIMYLLFLVLNIITNKGSELSKKIRERDCTNTVEHVLIETQIPRNHIFLEHIVFPRPNSSLFLLKISLFRRTNSKSQRGF